MATVSSGLVVLMLAMTAPLICGKRSVEEDSERIEVKDSELIEVNSKVNAHNQGHSHLAMGTPTEGEKKPEQPKPEQLLKQEDVKKYMYDDEGKKVKIGDREVEMVGDGLFIRFKIKNCLGRWVADKKQHQPLMNLETDKPEPECSEEVQTAVKEAQSNPNCTGQPEEILQKWESEECGEAVKTLQKLRFGKKFFARLKKFDQWVKDEKTKATCENDAEMHKYHNKMKYIALWPTPKAVDKGLYLMCPTGESEDNYFPFKFGFKDCEGKKNCKLLKGMVLVIGGSREDTVTPWDASSPAWQKKYTECDEDQKKLFEGLDDSSASKVGNFVIALLFATAGQLLL